MKATAASAFNRVQVEVLLESASQRNVHNSADNSSYIACNDKKHRILPQPLY